MSRILRRLKALFIIVPCCLGVLYLWRQRSVLELQRNKKPLDYHPSLGSSPTDEELGYILDGGTPLRRHAPSRDRENNLTRTMTSDDRDPGHNQTNVKVGEKPRTRDMRKVGHRDSLMEKKKKKKKSEELTRENNTGYERGEGTGIKDDAEFLRMSKSDLNTSNEFPRGEKQLPPIDSQQTNLSPQVASVNKDIVAKILNFAKEIAAINGSSSRSGNQGPLLLTLINKAYLPLTYNWLCHTESMTGLHERVVFLVQGARAERQLRSQWPKLKTVNIQPSSSSYSSDDDNNGDDEDDDDDSGKEMPFQTVGYIHIIVLRTQIIHALLLNNLSLVLFETDFIWFQDPVSDLLTMGHERDLDIVGTVSKVPDQIMCGAFIYFRSTPRMRTLWTEVTRRMQEVWRGLEGLGAGEGAPNKQNEQVFLNQLLKRQFAGARYGLADYSTVADGVWYSMKASQRMKLRPKAIHNNFLKTARAKIKRFKDFLQWVLSPDQRCDVRKVASLLGRGGAT